MILSQISYLDCAVFLIFLVPQLILHVGLISTAIWLLFNLPSLALPAIRIPFSFVYNRYLVRNKNKSAFIRTATPFQDLVIRFVRYAFAYLPAHIGRIFFSKHVALPFLRFRMLRHGYLQSPIKWREIHRRDFSALWIIEDPYQTPDIAVLYCHGGGFSMGSSYFYLEFLLAWITLLKQAGYKNPAILSLEYSLVPDAAYPTQLNEGLAAYEYLLTVIPTPRLICVAGDSAGGTIILSLLLTLSHHPLFCTRMPGYATLISPWTTIITEKHRNTPSDYLDAIRLEHYGRQYLGHNASAIDEIASPGSCKDVSKWKRASPTGGWLFIFGSEEVLAPEIWDLVQLLRKTGKQVEAIEQQGAVHAWPVASLYLGEHKASRLHGLSTIVTRMSERIGSSKQEDGSGQMGQILSHNL